MRELPLDDLPKHSPWSARLLGLDDWDGESYGGTGVSWYDGAYGGLLELASENPEFDFRDVKRSAHHHTQESPVAISERESLYLADIDEKLDRQEAALVAAFDGVLSGEETVVALGCGWGHELGVLADAYPDCEFVGGEPSENGVALARELFGDRDRIRVEPFDFREDSWEILDCDDFGVADSEVVVFTQGSLTALPSAREVVTETLVDHLDRVREGVHLEHVFELNPEDTLLGQLRRSYIRERGYNDDLLASLRDADAIDVTETTYDVVGGNPLHPLSEVHWRPA
ncbi:class I SAM-dependent methyltransferase [Halorussus salilacus]|uniref:class I SAM-dependent methyltransferase n=1 Tax=Halorussus salilacus TaxID=2953750 RepID=UPI00209F2227|nr:class I SAM-dependent methyltransferase [Halorussus salilacus]USZ67725.1 class I SAM-dependent methyltransferase [Halorussus salilacus]